jgi:hypothetical protein
MYGMLGRLDDVVLSGKERAGSTSGAVCDCGCGCRRGMLM